MSRLSISTPCPVSSSLDRLLATEGEETTTTIDFTTAFRASFRDAKPKRRQGQALHFAIHEDVNEYAKKNRKSQIGLVQPPRRIPSTMKQGQGFSTTSSEGSQSLNVEDSSASQYLRSESFSRLRQAPKRPLNRLSILPEDNVKDPTSYPRAIPADSIKPARRGTIFIPNDDTTMPSIYMGVFSPIKDPIPESGEGNDAKISMEISQVAAPISKKWLGRKNTSTSGPRRATLQPNMRPLQGLAHVEDRYGQGSGKENVPPGSAEIFEKLYPLKAETYDKELCKPLSRPSSIVAQRHSVYAPTASSRLKSEPIKGSTIRTSQARPAWNGGPRMRSPNSTTVPYLVNEPLSPQLTSSQPAKSQVPSRFIIPAAPSERDQTQYAILDQDIKDPSLYEENWLSHQEIAITQLVNSLFSRSKSNDSNELQTLRSRLLDYHCSEKSVLMHRRLQAALLYGSLSIPQETLDQGAKLQNDVGLRKRFLDLWMCTYDIDMLTIALEVVVGRECRRARSRNSSTNSPVSRSSKSELRTFIEAFMIRNEDGKPALGTKSHSAWSYQRTLLRSLLLIKILDLVRSESHIGVKNCLFQQSSPFKDSQSVLQSLTQMLNPAAGDPLRALSHIGYNVTHVQYPLEEFNYEIHNLAVDIRDGIRLTRLVELLLYPPTALTLETTTDDGNTTIAMPEGEMLDFKSGQDWPLSQHLKTTCQSKAVKIWNVQIALSAMKDVKGMGALIEGICAEDIVDGFREKTIKLLWVLVSRWGLSGLINWQDVRWEVCRLERSTGVSDYEQVDDAQLAIGICTPESCEALLKRWSRSVALSAGLEVRNFTTSFADGKVFESIINAYEPHMTTANENYTTSTGSQKSTLRMKLARLGCSEQFSQLFADQGQSHIFDRDFVLAALAFLCSRLLVPSQRSRAASVIQQAWRRYWSKVEQSRKQEKQTIALACVAAVTAKHENLKLSNTIRIITPIICDQTAIPQPGTQTKRLPKSPVEEDIWLSLQMTPYARKKPWQKSIRD